MAKKTEVIADAEAEALVSDSPAFPFTVKLTMAGTAADLEFSCATRNEAEALLSQFVAPVAFTRIGDKLINIQHISIAEIVEA